MAPLQGGLRGEAHALEFGGELKRSACNADDDFAVESCHRALPSRLVTLTTAPLSRIFWNIKFHIGVPQLSVSGHFRPYWFHPQN